ncbi:sorting nexin-24-like isoform X2 [Tachypleus tridentatus]|uniref:sorting nexin-24-like isoform X2 n=1 Tax=Tachypleus tridentatus TaxID=6853 RepID=UPI003FD1E155
MIRAFIPSFRQAEGEHGGHFTVYRIEVYVSGRCQKIERRYRAFHALHKQLKRLVQTPSFPPKKMRNSSPKFIEQRRQALEHYVQSCSCVPLTDSGSASTAATAKRSVGIFVTSNNFSICKFRFFGTVKYRKKDNPPTHFDFSTKSFF